MQCRDTLRLVSMGGEKRVMNTEATTLSYNEFVLGRMGLAD